MPADADSLAALGELASASVRRDATATDDATDNATDNQVTVAVPLERPASPRRIALPGSLARIPALRSPSTVPVLAAVRALPRRTRLVALAVGSVVAGMLAGLVLPVASAQPAPTSTARSIIVILPAARTAQPSTAPTSPAGAPARQGARSSTTAVAAAAAPAAPRTVAPALTAASAVDWAAVDGGAVVPAPRATATVARSAAEAVPARPSPATVAAATAYRPTRKLPAASGSGRRIVYSQHKGHVWVVGTDGQVVRDYPVTGRIGRPKAGTYRVFSKSPTAVNPQAKVRFDLMVRFAHGITGAPIGFHTIPRWYDGRPIQREDQLGAMIGAGGCVRQSKVDARWLYRWSRVGDTVVVLR